MTSNIVAVGLLLVSVALGYALATWGPLQLRSSPVELICSRVDYMDGLQKKLKGEEAPIRELRDEFLALVRQCNEALSGRVQEN